MIRPFKVAWRALQIARTALHYRLDGILEGTRLAFVIHLLAPFTARGDARIAALPTGARLKLALESLGPIFVKAGQVLSTRRDLLPGDVADELAKLQDQVAAFPGSEARAIIEAELGCKIDAAFDDFDEVPLASASIAQVHAATLKDGREVVIKVLRPGVRRQIASDIRLLHALAALATRFGPDPHRIRPAEVVAEIERSLSDELDLQREGANASLLRRNFAGSDDLIVPEIHWSLSSERILTMDRVYGIPSDDVAALDAAGIDRSRLAAKGVELFYTQVFRDNFFHADAHAGNIWVDPTRVDEPRFIALDFGIMGSLPERDQYFVAENFTAIFNRDYRRIAELHIEAGWMPSTLRVDELESAVRTVCEPYFTRPLSEIALGEVMAKLFHVARRYQLTIQPQLILLQKTLLNIEGVGRLLDPKLDIWATAKPVLAEILAQRSEPAALMAKFKRRLPTLLSMAEDMPRLVHGFFERGVEGRQIVTMRSDELVQLVTVSTRGQRQTVAAIFGSGLALCAVVIWRLGAGLAVWAGFPVAAWVCAGVSVAAFLYAFRR